MWFAAIILLSVVCAKVVAVDRPTIWLGNAPFCVATAVDCNVYDLDYVTSDRSGDGGLCWTGRKVLCQARGNASRGNTDTNKLVVVSYNVEERPYVVQQNGQVERTCHIPRALSQKIGEADVIVFKELFIGGCLGHMRIRDLLRFYGFYYTTQTIGSQFTLPGIINGGVFIASRWPILRTTYHVFPRSSDFNLHHFVQKGVIYAQVTKQSRTYHIFGGHFAIFAGRTFERTRRNQANIMLNFIKQQNIPQTDSVIVAADFNCGHTRCPVHANEILTILNVQLPVKIGHLVNTWDPSRNDLIQSDSPGEWLDFIGYYKGSMNPTNTTMTAVELLSDRPFEFCSDAPAQPFYVHPWSVTCRRRKTTRHLSAHFPVVSMFMF